MIADKEAIVRFALEVIIGTCIVDCATGTGPVVVKIAPRHNKCRIRAVDCAAGVLIAALVTHKEAVIDRHHCRSGQQCAPIPDRRIIAERRIFDLVLCRRAEIEGAPLAVGLIATEAAIPDGPR